MFLHVGGTVSCAVVSVIGKRAQRDVFYIEIKFLKPTRFDWKEGYDIGRNLPVVCVKDDINARGEYVCHASTVCVTCRCDGRVNEESSFFFAILCTSPKRR